MVIQSITVCNKQGNILVGRQYTNISKLQYEEMIKTFPKQIQDNQQHTFTELNNQRFIYLPLEKLYLLLITTKNSNIIDDLETIRILHRLVVDNCKETINEQEILNNAFNYLLIFDDVVSFGYRESVTQEQVKDYLKMQSIEENLYKMLKIAKENEAKENAKKFIKEKSKEQGKIATPVYQSQEKIREPIIIEEKPKQQEFQNSKFNKKQGLVLQQKKIQQKQIVQEKIQQEEPQKQFNPLSAVVYIELQESLNCQISKEGDLQNFEIIGEIQLRCFDQSKLKLGIQLSQSKIKNLQLKPHPSLNKQTWTQQNILSYKTDQFPCNQTISAIKYKFQSQDIKQVPFIFTHWFNENSLTLELEYNQTQLFKNIYNLLLVLQFPFDSEIESIENSTYDYKNQNLNWKIEELSQNVQNCNIVINFKQNVSIEQCFPIMIQLHQENTLSEIQVLSVTNFEDQQQVKYEQKCGLRSQDFQVV